MLTRLIKNFALLTMLTLFSTLFSVPKAYVANEGNNTVSVFDTSQNGSPIATVTVGTNPFYVAVTPDGSKVYVTNVVSSNVSVINTTTDTVIATVPVGVQPYFLAITPDGTKAYVANRMSDTVSVINTSTYTVIATVTVGSEPYSLAVIPDGTKVYVGNLNSLNVSVINTSTNTVIGTVTVGSAPSWVAVSPDSTRVYVTNEVGNNVSVINTSTETVIATVTVGLGPYHIVLTPNGAKAYVANFSDTKIHVINTSTFAVAPITVGTQPIYIGLTPNGSKAYVTNRGSDNVSVIDTSTDTVTATLSQGGLTGLYFPAVTAAGTKVYVTGDTGFRKVVSFSTITNLSLEGSPEGSTPRFIAVTPFAPPTSFQGVRKNNNFALVSESFNALSWIASTASPTGYYLTRNGVLIATLGPEVNSYEDHNRNPSQADTYTLTAFNSLGGASTPVTITVGGS